VAIRVEHGGRPFVFGDEPDLTGEPDAADIAGVYSQLRAGRLYEAEFLDYIASLARPGVYVDVGALIGTHSLFFALACPATRVHAFEPRTRFVEELIANIERNSASELVTVHAYALADRAGVVETEMRPGHRSSFEARRLDDVLREPIALLKVDVEGMEPQVLNGAGRLLRRYGPLVFAEAWPGQYQRLVRAMAAHGYRPTGRVFNRAPTYEFEPAPRVSFPRQAYLHLPELLKRPLRRIRARGRLLPIIARACTG
jgi:FkbM family methyltransferase